MDVWHSHHACPGISQWLLANALASIISKISNLELKANPRAVQFRWLFDDGDFLSHLTHHLAWILWTREDSTVAVSMVVTRKILAMRSRWTSCEILLPYLYSSKEKTLDHSYMCDSRYILVYHHGLESNIFIFDCPQKETTRQPRFCWAWLGIHSKRQCLKSPFNPFH